MNSDWFVEDDLARSVLSAPRKEIFVAVRNDSAGGDGSRSNPYGASTAAQFDLIMQSLERNTVVNLGPGLFRTKGGQEWNIQPGVTIRGAGIFATILRLTVQPPNANAYGASCVSGTGPYGLVDGVEVSDLTFDCNLGGQPNSPGYDFPKVAVGSVYLNGKNNRVRRIRVINFGTRTPLTWKGADRSYDSYEDFPCLVGGDGSSIDEKKGQSSRACCPNKVNRRRAGTSVD